MIKSTEIQQPDPLGHGGRFYFFDLKAKFQCHPARCLLPVEIMQRCGLATGPDTVELLPYLLPY